MIISYFLTVVRKYLIYECQRVFLSKTNMLVNVEIFFSRLHLLHSDPQVSSHKFILIDLCHLLLFGGSGIEQFLRNGFFILGTL